MLRNDGEYTIYRVQHESDGKWVDSNLDYFGYPEGFNAGGKCWQTTGVIGTFDLDEAVKGLSWLSSKYPEERWRIVKVTISQQTVAI